METNSSVPLKLTTEVSESCWKFNFYSFFIRNTELLGNQMALRKM